MFMPLLDSGTSIKQLIIIFTRADQSRDHSGLAFVRNVTQVIRFHLKERKNEVPLRLSAGTMSHVFMPLCTCMYLSVNLA